MLRKKNVVIIYILILLASFQFAIKSQQLKFVAYGDSRSNASMHNTITGLINTENPQLVLHSGDLWDGYSSSTWVSHFTSKPNLNNLLNNNKILVARGNHESVNAVLGLSPSFVRNNSVTYSFREGNVFFVCLSMNPTNAATFLETELQKPESQSADFRVIYHHYPIYSSGSHSSSGNSTIEALCDQYDVAMSFAGHDHDYERTKVMYNGAPVFSGNDVPSNVKGTTYIVTGGGGAPPYSVGTSSWTDYSESIYHYCVLNSYSDRIEMTVKDETGAVIETFVRRKASTVTYELSTSTVGSGVINPSNGNFPENSVVNISATGNVGWAFDHWEGSLTGNTNPTTITMDGNKNVTATFVQVPIHTLNTNVNGLGSIELNPAGGNYSEGASVLLTAIPGSGWQFVSWGGDVTGSTNPKNLIMDVDKSVTATFEELPPTIGTIDVLSLSTNSGNRRAAPYIMSEEGTINSISMYHTGGVGNMVLAVYSGTSSFPNNRLGVTPVTQVSSTTGWQTIDLINSITVSAGQQIWLAWVYETNPGIFYNSGDPGRVDAGEAWSGGMPDPWGATATQSSYIYSIYANYKKKVTSVNSNDLLKLNENIPKEYQLFNAFPNPFNPGTNIKFSIPEDGVVDIRIYNSIGQLVRNLVNNEYLSAGAYNYFWNGRNENNIVVPSGIYLFNMRANDFNKSVKVILLK